MKNKFIIEYFSFSVREKNGILVLFILLLIIVVTLLVLKKQKEDTKYNFEIFEDKIDEFLSVRSKKDINIELFNFDPNKASIEDFSKLGLSKNAINSICNYRNKGGKFYTPEDLKKIYNLNENEFEIIKDYIVIENNNYKAKHLATEKHNNLELFIFDPNKALKTDFEKLGLNSWQIQNILKFRAKGGNFNTPEDFSKIYGINNELFNLIKPYIQITDIPENKETSKSDNIINLNTATDIELQKLNGIGPSFSKRIIEYRNKLGGFINSKQLLEIYGFKEETLLNIKDYLIIDTSYIKKININKAEYVDLIKHPYINKDNTKKILNYRNFAKNIKSFEELLNQKAIDKDFYEKLLPYITTE